MRFRVGRSAERGNSRRVGRAVPNCSSADIIRLGFGSPDKVASAARQRARARWQSLSLASRAIPRVVIGTARHQRRTAHAAPKEEFRGARGDHDYANRSQCSRRGARLPRRHRRPADSATVFVRRLTAQPDVFAPRAAAVVEAARRRAGRLRGPSRRRGALGAAVAAYRRSCSTSSASKEALERKLSLVAPHAPVTFFRLRGELFGGAPGRALRRARAGTRPCGCSPSTPGGGVGNAHRGASRPPRGRQKELLGGAVHSTRARPAASPACFWRTSRVGAPRCR